MRPNLFYATFVCAAVLTAGGAISARGQATLAPAANAPVAVPDAQPDSNARLEALAHQLAATQPAFQAGAESAKLRVSSPAIPTAVQPSVSTPPAVPESKNESLPLGHVSSNEGPASPVSTSNGSWVLHTITALAVVLGLIFIVKAVVQKSTGRAGASAINPALEVLARVSVAPRNHVLLIRLGRRILAVGDSGGGSGGLRTLADIDDPEEVAYLLTSINANKPHSATRGFNEMLGRFNGEYVDDEQVELEGADEQEQGRDRARDSVSGLMSRLKALAGRGA